MSQQESLSTLMPNLGNPIGTKFNPEIFEPTVMVDVLDPALRPVLEALRLWSVRGDPPSRNIFFSRAPAMPHLVLLCGIPTRNEAAVMQRIAEWRKAKVFVIWLVPPSAFRDFNDIECCGGVKEELISAADATVLVQRLIAPVPPLAASDCWTVTRAARGLVCELVFRGLVGIDFFDIKCVLTASDRRPLVHFSLTSQSKVPPNGWWPAAFASRRISQCMVASIMPDQDDMLRKFESFIDEMRNCNDPDTEYVTTLGFDKSGGNFGAEIYARLS